MLLSGAERHASRPGTDNALLTLEHASDDELHAAGHQHLSVRQAAVDDEAASGSGGTAAGGPAR